MNGDFFHRLAERTLGVAPVAKPDLMPLFAVTPEIAAMSDPIFEPEETQVRTTVDNGMQPQRRGDLPAPRVGPTQPRSPERDVPRNRARRREPALESAESNGAPAQRQIEPENRDAQSPEARPSIHTHEITEIEHREVRREIATRRRISLTEIADRIDAMPAALSPQSARQPAAPAPSVHISIGRVEVRATVPPAQAPRAAERKAPQRLSLEQYLRERNEGRR